ncbi:MAG: hypothetical protein M1840_004363 [Geoglossum simile]|nr:MAG: hypothetical protein M1840_004363 [Geoglossum simile]
MATRTDFFINGFGISRQVLLSNLPLYLGPDAICRSYSHQGRDGYLISAPRQLTDAQLADLRAMSARWEADIAERRGDTGVYGVNRPENLSDNTYSPRSYNYLSRQ